MSHRESPAASNAAGPANPDNYVRRVVIVFAAAAVAFALYKLAMLFLLVAGAVMVAVVIHLLADPLRERLGFPPKLAALASVAALTAIVAAALFLFGAKAAAQFDRLAENLPQAADQMRDALTRGPFGRAASELLSQGDGASAADIAGLLRSIAGGFFTIIVSLVSTLTAGVIFAMYPARYRDGALLLLPPRMRPKVREAVNLSGRALKGWLVGQLVAMGLIGALTSLGLSLIGMPSWLALGLLAGFAQFVPVVGPILSAIPALLLAGSMDGSMLVKTFAVYVGVQQLESNFITPLVMRKAAALPMALTVLSIIGFGLLFGPLGAIVATPATVAGYVLVQKLYIEDQFGDRVRIKGA